MCERGRITGCSWTCKFEREMKNMPAKYLGEPNFFSVRMLWNPSLFNARRDALKWLDDRGLEDLHKSVILHLLGRPPPESDHPDNMFPNTVDVTKPKKMPGLLELNISQLKAVKYALDHRVALVQGPPGTGKTVTAAGIVYGMVMQEKALETKRSPVLVCCVSNVAVDQLTGCLETTGLKIVRPFSGSYLLEGKSHVAHLSLDECVIRRLEEEGEHCKDISELNPKERDLFERKVLQEADVVCTTCVYAGLKGLSWRIKFSGVLIDEATQAIEPDTVMAIRFCAQHLVLVGDHMQLGPVVQSLSCRKAGFDKSLFQRLVELCVCPVRLELQYHMHPALSAFPSVAFYDGRLQNGISAGKRAHPPLPANTDGAFHTPFLWPCRNVPLIFYNCSGREEISSTGTSYLNTQEADICAKFVTALCNSGISLSDIGVITPYLGQRAYLSTLLGTRKIRVLGDEGSEGIEVDSVDAFQGREKEHIILSCVRSSEKGDMGFLTSKNRLNVSITRAKRGLIIIGNVQTLANNPLWRSLIVHCSSQGVLVQGPLNALEKCMVPKTLESSNQMK